MKKKLLRENPPEEFEITKEESIYPAFAVFICILLALLILMIVVAREIIL